MSNASTAKKNAKGFGEQWRRFDAMAPAERQIAAASDPDNRPLTSADFKRMKRTPRVKIIRRALGLTQQEFSGRFGIPIGTLRDWEQGAAEPDQAARTYLAVIANNPEAVTKALHGKAEASINEEKLARLIGLITIRWHELHSNIHQIFSEAFDRDRRASEVFFSLRSDASQRDATTALVEALFPRDETLLREMRKLFGEIGRAAQWRDNTIHVQGLFGKEMPAERELVQELEKYLVSIEQLDKRTESLLERLKNKTNPASTKRTRVQVREAFVRGLQKRLKNEVM